MLATARPSLATVLFRVMYGPVNLTPTGDGGRASFLGPRQTPYQPPRVVDPEATTDEGPGPRPWVWVWVCTVLSVCSGGAVSVVAKSATRCGLGLCGNSPPYVGGHRDRGPRGYVEAGWVPMTAFSCVTVSERGFIQSGFHTASAGRPTHDASAAATEARSRPRGPRQTRFTRVGTCSRR